MTDEDALELAKRLWKESENQGLPKYFEEDVSERLRWVNRQLPPNYILQWDPSTDGGHALYIQLRRDVGTMIDVIRQKEETK